MNLSDWAQQVGVSKHSAYRWYHAGALPVPARRVGRLILVEPAAAPDAGSRTVVYARVSSADQRPDLDRQVARLTSWITGNGQQVSAVITEIGSAMNGRRRKLGRILADPAVTQIVVEHRDPLARFGVEHLQAALAAQRRQIMILDIGKVEDDLVRDMTEVLTSFRARLYGRRGTRNRAQRALDCARAE